MKVIVEPGSISGAIAAPSSKSITQRAYAAALLHKGTTIIHHAGNSDDEQAALEIIQQLGAKITDTSIGVPHLKNVWDPSDTFSLPLTIKSEGINPISGHINCRESGLSARLFTPIAAICGNEIRIDGTGSLLKRHLDGFLETLPALGIGIPGFTGYLPFSVQGPLQARSVKVNAAGGSQFLSGLLFALSGCATEPITISVTGLKSKPYIDLTLGILSHFGKPIKHNNYREFYIDPAIFVNKETIEINIAGDWSSAAFMLVAGALAGNISVTNLNFNSKQADKAIIDVLKNAGAEMAITDNSVTVKSSFLQPFEFDATHCPDLFPILAVLATCCNGESCIKGVHRLFNKESNRVASIADMLWDFQVPFSMEDDTLSISGQGFFQGTRIDSQDDHRIVMAAAIAALRANGPVEISNAIAINKSYPDFFKDLILCGGNCTFINEEE